MMVTTTTLALGRVTAIPAALLARSMLFLASAPAAPAAEDMTPVVATPVAATPVGVSLQTHEEVTTAPAASLPYDCPLSDALPSSAPPQGHHSGLEVADLIQVWSKNCSEWCLGTIDEFEGKRIWVHYRNPRGHLMSKENPIGHPDLQAIDDGSTSAPAASPPHACPPSDAAAVQS